jgi:phosphoribulokinase
MSFKFKNSVVVAYGSSGAGKTYTIEVGAFRFICDVLSVCTFAHKAGASFWSFSQQSRARCDQAAGAQPPHRVLSADLNPHRVLKTIRECCHVL